MQVDDHIWDIYDSLEPKNENKEQFSTTNTYITSTQMYEGTKKKKRKKERVVHFLFFKTVLNKWL